MSETPEKADKTVEEIVNKVSKQRYEILEKAREAKKAKKDVREELIKNHTAELKNIDTHISKIYSQMNLIVDLIPGKTARPKQEESDDESEKPAKKTKTKEVIETVAVAPLVVGEATSTRGKAIAELAGKAVGSFIVAGGLYYMKSYLDTSPKNKAHVRYDTLN